MPSLTLGDGTLMKTEGWIDQVQVNMTSRHGRTVKMYANFLVVQSLPEQVVIGHQYFLESHRTTGRSAEISYPKKAYSWGGIKSPGRISFQKPLSVNADS